MSIDATREPVIQAIDLEHTYDNGFQALRGIDLTIYKGDYVGLIGQNGSGKTTMIKHFNGLLRPTKGKILINGADATTLTVGKIAKQVGFVFQNPDHQIFCPSVREELAFGPKNCGMSPGEMKDAVEDALESFRITEFAEHPPAILGFGLRRKVSLAAVYSCRPTVFIMDEPTVGLDHRSARELLDIIGELNGNGDTIILITHDMRVICENTKRGIVLRNGKLILDGTTREVMSNIEVLRQTQIRPPQVIELSKELSAPDVAEFPLNVDEFINEFIKTKKAM